MPASPMNPGARVRIQGLRSRGDLNGKEATVRNATMNGRFVVLVQGSGEQISLKPGNMELLAAAPAAGGSGASGSPFSAERIAEVQRQVQQFLSQFRSMLPPGTNPSIVLGGGAIVLGIFAFTFGLMTTALLVSVLVFAARHGADSFRSAGGGTKGVKAAANTVGGKVANKVQSVTGFSLSPMQALGLVGVVLLFILRITSGVGSGMSAPRRQDRDSSFDTFSSTVGVDDDMEEDDPLIFDSDPTYDWKDMEVAYKAGYDDAIDSEKSFQDSLAELKKKPEKKNRKSKKKRRRQRRRPAMNEYDEMPPPSSYASQSSGAGGGFGFMKIFTLGIIGKTVYDLGNSASGWDQQTFLMNLQAMPKWRLALNAFLVLRLVGMSPI